MESLDAQLEPISPAQASAVLVLANSEAPMMTAKAASAKNGERIWILLEGVPLALSTPGAGGLFPQTIWVWKFWIGRGARRHRPKLAPQEE